MPLFDRAVDFIQSHSKLILILLAAITLFLGLQIESLTFKPDFEAFVPADVWERTQAVMRKFELKGEPIYVYIEALNSSVLSLPALKEQQGLASFLEQHFDVDVTSVAALFDALLRQKNSSIEQVTAWPELAAALAELAPIAREYPESYYELRGNLGWLLSKDFDPDRLFSPASLREPPAAKATLLAIVPKSVLEKEQLKQLALEVRAAAKAVELEHIKTIFFSEELLAADSIKAIARETSLLGGLAASRAQTAMTAGPASTLLPQRAVTASTTTATVGSMRT